MGQLEVAVLKQHSKQPSLFPGSAAYFPGAWPGENEPLFDLGTRLTLLGIPEFVRQTQAQNPKLLGCKPSAKRRLDFAVVESEEFKTELMSTLKAKIKVWADQFKASETKDALQKDLDMFISFQQRNGSLKIQAAISCPLCVAKGFLIKLDKDGKPSSPNGWNKKRFVSHFRVHEKIAVE